MADTAYISFIAALPVLAAGFAVPQFLPQILKLRRTHDITGLSTPWALLTGINNAAWFAYFAASHYWFALIPSSSAAVLGGSARDHAHATRLWTCRQPRAYRRMDACARRGRCHRSTACSASC